MRTPRASIRRYFLRRVQERASTWQASMANSRGDRRHHTERLLAREVEHTWPVAGNDAAFDLVRKAAKVVEPLRKVMKLCPHFEKELSVVGGLNFREPVCLTGHDIAEPAKQRAPRSGGQLSPGISVK